LSHAVEAAWRHGTVVVVAMPAVNPVDGAGRRFGAHRLKWRWVLGSDAEDGDEEQTGTDAA
jgi:hypothetical protein